MKGNSCKCAAIPFVFGAFPGIDASDSASVFRGGAAPPFRCAFAVFCENKTTLVLYLNKATLSFFSAH
jgi:hypothetical protein